MWSSGNNFAFSVSYDEATEENELEYFFEQSAKAARFGLQ